jgi:rod shape-determining protein MreD
MLEGEKKGAIIGLIIGLIYDSQSITVGFNSVLFMLFAYIVGVSIIFMLRKNIFSAITLTVTGVLIQSIITILFFYINKGNNSFLYSFLHLVIPKIIVTVIFLIPIYFIFNAIGKNISIERRV